MESLYDSSVYTYRDWAMEYTETEDSRSWTPEKLEDEKCLAIFNRTGLCASMTINNSNEKCVIAELRALSMSEDDFFMEPLLSRPDECAETLSFLFPDPSREKMPVPICMSFYGSKNIIFEIPQCLLCVRDRQAKVYISSRIIKRITNDVSYKDIQCEYSGMRRGIPFSSLTVLDRCMASAFDAFHKSRKRRLTKDYMPMHAEGFTEYAIVDAVVTMCIVSSRETTSSDFRDDFVVLHGKRKLKVYVHQVSTSQRNRVASLTRNGNRNALQERCASTE